MKGILGTLRTAVAPKEKETPASGGTDTAASGSWVAASVPKAVVDKIDPKLEDVFCRTFGEEYRGKLTPTTDMDAVENWDSKSFLDLVLALEDAYGLTFSDSEAAQFFQIGHIQRILWNAHANLPHDDVAHACCQLDLLRKATAAEYKVVVLSGSSTREGFVSPAEGVAMLRQISGREKVGWYNISVSGLVAAEALQLVEVIGRLRNGLLVLGYSPIILGGCGEVEFRRAATHERFPFAAPRMDALMAEAGYRPTPEEIRPSVDVRTWVERYLKQRDLAELHFEPYLYPTLSPWGPEKYSDEASILRFYNNAILNFDQSIEVNAGVFRAIGELCRKKAIPLAFLELTLHSETLAYLEHLGKMVSRADAVLASLRKEFGLPFVEAVKAAGIHDADFRDPAHIFRKREEFTQTAIDAFVRIAPPAE